MVGLQSLTSTQKSIEHNLRGQFYLLLFDKMTITIKFFTLMRMVSSRLHNVQRFANPLWGNFIGRNYSGNT